ncbi:hypothetical protein [Rheinheimera sp. MMS21-TC3]|uniref:hypothetical protein n=1 Tax=Rheinheimera sp. MMS21-TC3 TaxID=3072790 RepID=UPI0028C48065|nr:hypothetical protein [Rheinheimera sp. MMS21-TC3]WNO59441.1 hypothetical protein RDV63_00290 [Rheinheimera sp. MMS21-TC3]
MKRLLDYLDGPYKQVMVDFTNSQWMVEAEIPTVPGWYFLSTDAPMEVFLECPLWQETYMRARDGAEVPVKNYDISKRAARYEAERPVYWNLDHVYSGLASSLRARAREHTFADPGTAGLALARYPKLHRFTWRFHYLELRNFPIADEVSDSLILKLGEQVWRTKFGWPILCAA